MRPSRRTLLSFLLGAVSLLVLSAKKIFDYAAAPDDEKESDFTFPQDPDQEKPTSLIAESTSPPITFKQRRAFYNTNGIAEAVQRALEDGRVAKPAALTDPDSASSKSR